MNKRIRKKKEIQVLKSNMREFYIDINISDKRLDLETRKLWKIIKKSNLSVYEFIRINSIENQVHHKYRGLKNYNILLSCPPTKEPIIYASYID